MALVHQATCPTCGQVHMVTGMRSVYAGAAVEVCGECLVREAEEALYEARRTAYEAAYAHPLSGGRTATRLLDDIKWSVLLRRVCKGRTEVETLRNIENFWNEVRKEVES